MDIDDYILKYISQYPKITRPKIISIRSLFEYQKKIDNKYNKIREELIVKINNQLRDAENLETKLI